MAALFYWTDRPKNLQCVVSILHGFKISKTDFEG